MTAPVPDCLLPYAERPAWVAWNSERRNGEARKVPKCPGTGGNASVADPRTWGTLAAARRLADVRAYRGVGIVSAAVPELVFFDLDRCVDPASGEPVNDDAARLLDGCANSYAECTPSGTGVRIIGTAEAIAVPISRKGTTPGGAGAGNLQGGASLSDRDGAPLRHASRCPRGHRRHRAGRDAAAGRRHRHGGGRRRARGWRASATYRQR
jgi:hypothetical protein